MLSDEPTNHLDIETIEALGVGLANYKGGVILVSHDQKLITLVCQELWVCSRYSGLKSWMSPNIFNCFHQIILSNRGKVWSMEGGLDEYVKLVEKEMQL